MKGGGMTSISVLTPVYNGMPYIQEAVESVQAQNFQNWEMIIGDNGSTDGTRNYLDTLQDPRIRVYKHETNLGVYENFNFLVRQAEAPVARALCADDWLLPDALERTISFMEERPYCAVSRCLARGDEKKQYVKHRLLAYERALPSHLGPEAAFLAHVTFGNPVGNLSQAAFRPKLILDSGGFDQSSYPHSADREAWARICRIYGLELQNEELIFERIHPKQNRLLLNLSNESFPQQLRILNIWAKEIARNDLADLKLVKLHWTIHHLSWRVPGLLRQIRAGQMDVVREMWKDLPLNISPAAMFAAYPIWKFNLPPSQSTGRRLLHRIVELNEGSVAA